MIWSIVTSLRGKEKTTLVWVTQLGEGEGARKSVDDILRNHIELKERNSTRIKLS